MTTHVSGFISRVPIFLWCLSGALLTACGGSGSSPTGPTPPPSGPGFVASGQISIPASSLHTRFAGGSTAAANLGSTTGRVLSISLRDVSGSTGTCDARCPSIDWSIGTETFANRLTVMTSAGTQTFFLTQNRGLASTPDDPDPT